MLEYLYVLSDLYQQTLYNEYESHLRIASNHQFLKKPLHSSPLLCLRTISKLKMVDRRHMALSHPNEKLDPLKAFFEPRREVLDQRQQDLIPTTRNQDRVNREVAEPFRRRMRQIRVIIPSSRPNIRTSPGPRDISGNDITAVIDFHLRKFGIEKRPGSNEDRTSKIPLQR